MIIRHLTALSIDVIWQGLRALGLKLLNDQPFISVNEGSSFQQMINAKLLSLNLSVNRTLQVTNLQTVALLALKRGAHFHPWSHPANPSREQDHHVNIIRIPRDVMFFDFGVPCRND